MRLYSHVTPEQFNNMALRGVWMGVVGCAMLLYSIASAGEGLWYNGWACVALLVAILGVLPYHHLRQIDRYPDRIMLDDELFCYTRRNRPPLIIPLHTIEECLYVQKKAVGGLLLRLKDGKELFFPYFHRRACESCQRAIVSITAVS